jgi:hypothetical protein
VKWAAAEVPARPRAWARRQSHGVSDQHGEFKFPTGTRTTPRQNYEAGLAEIPKPYEAYAGTVVPEFSDMTTDTLDWMRENAGIYQPMYNKFGNDAHRAAAAGRRPAGQPRRTT